MDTGSEVQPGEETRLNTLKELVMNPIVNFFKTHPDVHIPILATTWSACFDLSFSVAGKTSVDGYVSKNQAVNRPIRFNDSKGYVVMQPGDRLLLPTGLIFDIPQGYSLRLHPRSGIALKLGLTLANAEGVIDADYVQETFIMIWNTSEVSQYVHDGDRLCQAELVKLQECSLWEIAEAPPQKTNRTGGLGSTGRNEAVKDFVDGYEK
jgi:dUTP pyrophosphatase